MLVGDMAEKIGMAVALIFVVVVIALNPSISGIGYALIVIVGVCSIQLVRILYLDERDRRGQ